MAGSLSARDARRTRSWAIPFGVIAMLLSGCGGSSQALRERRPDAPSVSGDQQQVRAKMQADATAMITTLRGWVEGLPAAADGKAVSHARDILQMAKWGVPRFAVAYPNAKAVGADLIWDVDNAVGLAVRQLPDYAERVAESGRHDAAMALVAGAREFRRYWSPQEETALTRQINAWRDARRGDVTTRRKATALRACEAGAPTVAQFLRDGAPGSGGGKLDLKLPERCEGEVGSVAIRVQPTGVDPALLRAVQTRAASTANNLRLDPTGPWKLVTKLTWGTVTRRVDDGSDSVEVQTGTRVVANPEVKSCQSRLADEQRAVERERGNLHSARNASAQTQAVRQRSLQSAQEAVERTRKRCATLPPTRKEAVMTSRSYPTQIQTAEMPLEGTLELQPTSGSGLSVPIQTTVSALTVRHAAFRDIGVSSANPPPPGEQEVKAKGWEQVAGNVLDLVRAAAARDVKERREAVIAARKGPCMAHAEATIRLQRTDARAFLALRNDAKGRLDLEAFDDFSAAQECLGLEQRY